MGVDRVDDALSLILRATAFAAEKHRDQRRKGADASPYINHPIAVAHVLNQAGVSDPTVLAAALLHDTIEDTDTTPTDLEDRFGKDITAIVLEVTDDKSLSKQKRKRLQVEKAGRIGDRAKLVKLADKICNLREIRTCPPKGWSLKRKCRYFDWAKEVVDAMRGVNSGLERIFDAEFARRPR